MKSGASPRDAAKTLSPRASAASAAPKVVPPINTTALASAAANSSSFLSLAAASFSSRGAVTARGKLLCSVPGSFPSRASERAIHVPIVSNGFGDFVSSDFISFSSALQKKIQRDFSLKLQIFDIFQGRSEPGSISAPELRLFIHTILRCHPHCIMVLSDMNLHASSGLSVYSDPKCVVPPAAFSLTTSRADGLNEIISTIQTAKPSSLLEVALCTSRIFNSELSCLLVPQKSSHDMMDYVARVSELGVASSIAPKQYLDRAHIFRLIESEILKWASSFPPISNLAPLWAESHLCRALSYSFPEALAVLASPFDRLLSAALEFGSNKIALVVSDAVDCDIALAAVMSGKKSKWSCIQIPFLQCASMDLCYTGCSPLLQTLVSLSSSSQDVIQSGSIIASRSQSLSDPSLSQVVWMPQLQRKDEVQHVIVLSERLSSEARRFTHVNLPPRTSIVCVISSIDAQLQPMQGWKLIPCSFLAGYDRAALLQVISYYGFPLTGPVVSSIPAKVSCAAAHIAIQHARCCATLALPSNRLAEILSLTDVSEIIVIVVLFIESVVDVTHSSGPFKNLFYDFLMLSALSWRGVSYEFILAFSNCYPFCLNMLLQILDGFIIQSCGLYCIASQILAEHFQHRFLKQPTDSQRLHHILFEFYWDFALESQDAALEVLHHSCASGNPSHVTQIVRSFDLILLLATSSTRPLFLHFLERAHILLGAQLSNIILDSCQAFQPSSKSLLVGNFGLEYMQGMVGNLSWTDAQSFLELCSVDRARCCCLLLLHESCIVAPSFGTFQFDNSTTRLDLQIMSLSCNLLNHFLTGGSVAVSLPSLSQFSPIEVYLPWLFGPICLRALSHDAIPNANHILALKSFFRLLKSNPNIYIQPSFFLFHSRVTLSLGDADESRSSIQLLQNEVISWSETHLGPVHPFTVSAYALRSLHLMITACISDASSSLKQAISAMRLIDSVPFESKVLCDALSLTYTSNSSKTTEFSFSNEQFESKDALSYLLRGEWCWRVACLDVARASAALLMYRGESSDALPVLAYCKTCCWSDCWDDSLSSLSVPKLSLFLAFSCGRLDLAIEQIKVDKNGHSSNDMASDILLWRGELQAYDSSSLPSNHPLSWRFRTLSLISDCLNCRSIQFKKLHVENLSALQKVDSDNGVVDSALYLVHSACGCLAASLDLDVDACAQAFTAISRHYGSRHVYCILAQLVHAVALILSGSVSHAFQVFSSVSSLVQSNVYPYSSCMLMIFCSTASYWSSVSSVWDLAETTALQLLSQVVVVSHPFFIYSISSFITAAAALGKASTISAIVRQVSNLESSVPFHLSQDKSSIAIQHLLNLSLSASLAFVSGNVASHQSKFHSTLKFNAESAMIVHSSIFWWCQRHNGIQDDSQSATSALRASLLAASLDSFLLFAATIYLSGTLYSCNPADIESIRDIIDVFQQRWTEFDHQSGGIIKGLFLLLQANSDFLSLDFDAQEKLVVRARSHSSATDQFDNAIASSHIAIAHIFCIRSSFLQSLASSRLFADLKCMSFDIQVEWCWILVYAAKDCSDLGLLKTCSLCLDSLKLSACESDIIFYIIYHCCHCVISSSQDKFTEANDSFSTAKELCTSVAGALPPKLHCYLLCSGACMYEMRRSFQLAHESYTGLQSILAQNHPLSLSSAVFDLELQIILSDLSVVQLSSKLDALTSSCTSFPMESSVFSSLSRSRALLLERGLEFDKSEEHFRSVVIPADTAAFGGVSERLAWDKVCLGRLYMQRLQTSLAESALIDSFKIYRAIRGDQNSRIALILFELASVYERYGSYSQAFDRACKSIKILDRVPRESHWSSCEAYLGLGKFMLVIDNWSSSLEYLAIAATGFESLQGIQAIAARESAAYAAFAEHLISCDAESFRKCKRRIFSVLSYIASSSQPASGLESVHLKDSMTFIPSIAYSRWLSFIGACNVFSCNAIALRYIVNAKNICQSFSTSVAATLEPLLILVYVFHGYYSKAASLLTSRIPSALFIDTSRRNATHIGVEHADLLHAGAMLQYAVCNYKHASELLRMSKVVLSNQSSDGSDWTHHSVKLFRVDAIEAIVSSEIGASLKTIDSAKLVLDRLRLGSNHLLHHMLVASQIHCDIWKGCFSPASKQVILVAKDMRSSYKPSHMLNIRFSQLEAMVSVTCGNHDYAISSLSACQNAMYSGWSALNTAQPAGSGKMALFFMRVARDAHKKLGFGHRELCSCFAIRTFAFAFAGLTVEAEASSSLTQRCVSAVVNSMAMVREETRLSVFSSLSQLFIAMLQMIKGNCQFAFDSCVTCVDSMMVSGWTADNFWVSLGRCLITLSSVSLADLPKARVYASSIHDKVTSSSQSSSMLSSSMMTVVSAFSGIGLSESDILSPMLSFVHPSLTIPAHDEADALWAYPFVTSAIAISMWVSCHTACAQKFLDASLRFIQHTRQQGHPMLVFARPLSAILSADLNLETVFEIAGIRFDSHFNVVPQSMRFTLMNVCLVVDFILKTGEADRNWLQMLRIVQQLIEELPSRFKDEGLLQLHLWFCAAECSRRLNRCSEALQLLTTTESRYVTLGFSRPHVFLMQVHLAQARCLSALGRLKDAINIVRASVMTFEQFDINNSLSRTFRVEFGSMLIDLGSFSEASEFFEKGGRELMISEVRDASTLIGIGKLACYRGDSELLGKTVSAIRKLDVSADGNTQTSLDFLVSMQFFLNGDFEASTSSFQALVAASELQFGTSHPRTCECRGFQAILSVMVGSNLSASREQLVNSRNSMKDQGLDANSSSVVRSLLAIEAWIYRWQKPFFLLRTITLYSELGDWTSAFSIVKSIVRPCEQCSLDDIVPTYVYLRCCLKLGFHATILNDFLTLDSRLVAAGASSHPIVIMSKFVRVRALLECGLDQEARELFAATDDMLLPGHWSIMRSWCSAHVAYDSQQVLSDHDSDPTLHNSSLSIEKYKDIFSPWDIIQRKLPVTHRMSLRSQFNVARVRSSLGSCDGVQLFEPVLILQRQHLGFLHSDVLECSVALAEFLPSNAQSSCDAESIITDSMTQLSKLVGPTSPSFINAQLVWLRLCCSRGKSSAHFKDIIPTIHSILSKTKGLKWFSAHHEKQFHLLHAEALVQTQSWQAAAELLSHWQSDHCRDNRLKMQLSIMRSHILAAQVHGHLNDINCVIKQYDAAASHSTSQRHMLIWSKGMHLLQIAQRQTITVAAQLNSATQSAHVLNKSQLFECAADAFLSADSSVSSFSLSPALVSFRCLCRLRAAEAFLCSGSDSGLIFAQQCCDVCDSLCSECEPDDPRIRCHLLRTRANVLSACDSDSHLIEALYEQSAIIAPSLPLQQSSNISLLSLRVSKGQYSDAHKAADKLD